MALESQGGAAGRGREESDEPSGEGRIDKGRRAFLGGALGAVAFGGAKVAGIDTASAEIPETLGEISVGFEKIRADFAELLKKRDALNASIKGMNVEEAQQAITEQEDQTELLWNQTDPNSDLMRGFENMIVKYKVILEWEKRHAEQGQISDVVGWQERIEQLEQIRKEINNIRTSLNRELFRLIDQRYNIAR